MRTLSILSTLSLVVGAATAQQCFTNTGGTSANLIATTGLYPADDEGRSAPIDMLFGPTGFPMAGAAGPLTHVVVGSNGELYLTNGGAPADPYDYSGAGLDPLRGAVGASPRVWPLSTDLEGLAPTYQVLVDTSVAGACKVSWIDVEQYFSGGPQFRFSATLYSSGAIEFAYTDLPDTTWGVAGVSIGNGVGTGTETSVDLTASPDSGTLGLIYQEMFGAGSPSIAGASITLLPNGTGGYLAVQTCVAARHTEYGTGCHSYLGPDGSTVVELFAGTAAAKAALDGNAILYQKTATGFVANWLPGVATALFIPPSGGATTLGLGDDDTANITPSIAPPVPGGTAPVWTVSSNGILTADAIGNHDTSFFTWLPDISWQTGLAFYGCWRDFNPTEPGSGQVKYEEVGGQLIVTYDGVYEYFTSSPATFQWQVNLATGDVTMVWLSLATSGNVDDIIAGCTLAGTGDIPVSQSLTTSPVTLLPQVVLSPMTLSAAPAPVINPSTVVTYTAGGLPEFVPGSGIYLATCFLSVFPNPGGFDLAGILTTVPGCNAYILSLDLDLGAQIGFSPTVSWNLTFSNTFFAPGNVVAAQAVALFDPAFPLPNGEAGGFLLSNGVSSLTQLQ
ncbi:MAG: hypothetical protein JNL08_19690 [Planctomycetes bacterium]|nr:hypothetical protein [Planctomycetota bacterium]